MSEEKVAHSDAPSMSAQALRKIKKPIIERKRRERINDSLNQLKALVLDALNKDESRYSKMEKADILEMTVRHLTVVQRQAAAVTSPRENNAYSGSELFSKYRAGYHECATEVSRYMASMRGVDSEVQSRLLRHLSQKLQTSPPPDQLPSPTATSIAALPGVSLNSAVSPSGGVFAVVAPSSGLSNDALLRDAIPLYVTQSPLRMTEPSQKSYRSTRSPSLGDDVPELIRNKVICSSMTSEMTSASFHRFKTDAYSHMPKAEVFQKSEDYEMTKSVWRPW